MSSNLEVSLRNGRLSEKIFIGLRSFWLAQEDALFLWLPVFLISGIFFYFSLPYPLEPLPFLIILALAFIISFYPESVTRAFCLAVVAFCIGALLASFQLASLSGKTLETETVASFTATVEEVQDREGGLRLLLKVRTFQPDVAQDIVPELVRVTVRSLDEDLRPGDVVWLRAKLYPPPEAVSPYGYQFARWAYFRGIGAVGFAYGSPRLNPETGGGFKTALNRMRNGIASRIDRVIEGDAAALTIALSTGQRDRLPQTLQDNLRATGLAHILAISGLHMALVAGGVFWVVRYCLALFPTLTLRYPIKKWAAICALLAALFYLGLSGGAISTQRAFIMVCIAFFAILLDRPAISMRNLAVAALIVAAIDPSSVIEPGFQMSFAATASLIAVYGNLPSRWRHLNAERIEFARRNIFAKVGTGILIMLGFTLLTSIVGGVSTMPFGAYHFERVATYGLVGNLAVMPLFSFVVMPLVVLALALMPFGLEALPLTLLDYALIPLFEIAAYIAQWPGAIMEVGRQSAIVTGLISFGALWMMIVRGRARYLGILGLAALPFSAEPSHQVYIAPDGRSVIAKMADGSYARAVSRGSDYAYENWLSHERQRASVESRSFRFSRNCSSGLCQLDAKHGKIWVADRWEALCAPQEGDKPDVLIILEEADDRSVSACLQGLDADLIITRETMHEMGALALRKTIEGWGITSAKQTLGNWPWVR